MSQPTLTIRQFAHNVSAATRKVRDAADPFHAAYKGATPEQQAQLRTEWMLGHLTGQGFENPERILSRGKGKGASKAHIDAIDRAYSDFRYMVMRPVKAKAKAKAEEAVSHARLSSAVRQAGMSFLAEFEGDDLAEQVRKAKAALDAILAAA